MNDKRIQIRKLKSKLQVQNNSLYALLFYEKLEFGCLSVKLYCQERELHGILKLCIVLLLS